MPVSVKSYVVQGSVSLNVTVGQAQLGHINAFLDQKKLAEAWTELKALHIGTASELRGKTLAVSTTVLDIQPATDLTSVLAQISDEGGPGLTFSEQEHKWLAARVAQSAR